MPKSDKVYAAEVDTDYSELRFVTAKSEAAARKKFEDNDYDGCYPGVILDVRSVYGLHLATESELRDFPHLKATKSKKNTRRI